MTRHPDSILDTNIDFVDCILVAKSRIGDLELITFDGQLQKLKIREDNVAQPKL